MNTSLLRFDWIDLPFHVARLFLRGVDKLCLVEKNIYAPPLPPRKDNIPRPSSISIKVLDYGRIKFLRCNESLLEDVRFKERIFVKNWGNFDDLRDKNIVQWILCKIVDYPATGIDLKWALPKGNSLKKVSIFRIAIIKSRFRYLCCEFFCLWLFLVHKLPFVDVIVWT